MGNSNTAYLISYYLMNVTLVPAYSAVLHKTWKGTKSKFVFTVAGFLLVANLTNIIATTADLYMYKQSESYGKNGLIWTFLVSVFAQFFCFTQGHWVFAS